jgi:hypothetical protein
MKIVVLVAFLFGALLVGCNSSTNNSESGSSACVEPENPYEEGTGHYAGWEWAAEHDGSCESASQSFNEGCEEYDQQEAEYQKCEANKNK